MSGKLAEVVDYCLRCHQKFTKNNDKCLDCPFCFTCHATGAIKH